MNDENWYQQSEPPYDPGTSAPKQGMGAGMKVFLVVLVISGVMGVLCCGGLFLFVWKATDMATTDPARIREIQEEIAQIDLPEGWEPKFGVDGSMFGVQMKQSAFIEEDSLLFLSQLNVPGREIDEQMQEQIRRSIEQQGNNRRITVESSEERTLTVDGEETTFLFVKGKSERGEEFRQVTGSFAGRGGPAFLLFQTPEDQWNEEKVVQMIESIRK